MTSAIRPRRTGTRWPLVVPESRVKPAHVVHPLPAVILVDWRDYAAFRAQSLAAGRRLIREGFEPTTPPKVSALVCFTEIVP